MKKSFFSKLFISLSVLFALTSCDNFFSGNLIQEELQGLIEEANAAEIEIFIAADADTGSVAPNGIVIHKVGKSFPVIFTEAKGYQFSHWEVIDRETKKPIENVIAIADSKETETRFTVINDAKNVYLHPVCIERPVVTTYSPQYADTGVPRDTSITISFNKNISKSNDFSKIEITAGGVSVLDSYKKPVLNNNVLVFAADTNNLVSVTNTTKSLTVTVPRDLYYELGDQKITMGYDYSWTYNINHSSNDKAEITFNTSVASGKVTPSDTIKYNIGDTVSLKFEPNEGYSFSGWNIMDGDGNEIPDTVLKFADRNSISTSFTVMNKILAANITPKTNLLPTITSVSPNNAITGVPCDSEIEVSFNKGIQSKYINSKYIHIKDIYERDLTEYFKAPVPVLDVGSTTLCKSFAIAADYSKIDSLKDLVRRSGDLLDVKLVIDAEVQDLENIKLQNQYVYNYRINNITETSRPTINSLQIYKDINGNRTQLTKDSYEIWAQKEEDYYINHVKSIWINIDASDKGSGVKELYIKETLEYDNSLHQIGSFETKTVQYEPNMNYEYNFLTKSDGIVKLEFFVRDMLGNESLNDNNVWTYYVVKDTIFEQQELKHYSISHEQYDLGTEPTALNDVKKNKRAIYFYNLKDKTWFNGRIDSKNNYSFKLYWGEDKNNLIYSTTDVIYDDRLKVPDYPRNTRDLGAYYFVIPEDKIDLTKDTYYALVIIDGVGNEYFCTDLIYGAPVINKVSVKSNSKVEISMFNLDSLKDSEGYYIYYEKIEKNTGISSGLIHNTNPTESLNTFEVLSLDVSAYEYKFYVSKCSYTGGMGQPTFYNIGSLSEPKGTVEYIDGTDNSLILTPSDLDVHVESAGKNTGNYKLTYTVNQDKAARFDSIEAYYKYSLRGSETKVSLGNFTGEQNTFNGIVSHTIILPSTRSISGQFYYLKKGTNLTKYGIVAVKGSERYTIEIPAEDVSSFAVDNVPPKFKFNQICSATINSITYKSVPTDAYVLNSTDKKQLAAIDADIIHSDLQVNAAGNYYGRCYFIKSKTKWNSYDNVDPINDLSPEEIKQSNLYCDFEYTPLDDSVEIPLPEIEANTRYVLCFQMSDAEGNEFCGPVSFYTKKVTNKKAELSFVNGKSRFIYNILYPPMTNRYGRVSKYASYLNIQYFDISDNTWKYFRQKYIKNGDTYITPYFCNEFGGIPTRNSINDYNGYDYNEQIYFSPIIDYSNPPATAEGPKTSEKLFIRFSMSEAATCGYGPMDYSTAAMDGFTYFEPVYYYNQENCVSGLLNKVNDGYVVLADQPCIIYTVYSKTNYGESVTNWNLNVSDRSHLKTRQLNNLQRYTPDIDNVPIGSYYCVIAHFADGSSQMSQVYRK